MAERTIRAEHIGSLLRPKALLKAMRQRLEGAIDAADLHALQDKAVLEILARQSDIGIEIVGDGEFRRTGFLTGFMDAVEGFQPGGTYEFVWRGGAGAESATPNMRIVGNRLRARGRIAEEESAFLCEHSPGPFKITLPGPLLFAIGSWEPEVTDRVYGARGELVADAASILADEARALGQEGVAYIQIDSPNYTLWADEERRTEMERVGIDLDSFLSESIAGDNTILDAVRDDLTTGVHLCRGNSIGRWLAEGSYEPLAERLFSELRCDRLLLEYDDERSGGFAPLRFVPANKVVVLGLVSTKNSELESRDWLLRRIEEASQYVPIERLALSPQCGFASSGAGNPITPEEQWAKLELVAGVAEEVWGSGRAAAIRE